MRKAALPIALAVLAVVPLAAQQEFISRATSGELLAGGRHVPGIAQFVATYGADWEVRWDEQRGIPLLLQGPGVPLLPSAANGMSALSFGLDPDRDVTLDDAARAAAEFVEKNAELFQIVEGSLVLDRDRSHSTSEAARWNIELSARARNGGGAAFVFVRIENGNAVQFGTGGRSGAGAPSPMSVPDPLGLVDPAAAPCDGRSAYAVALFYDDDDGNLGNGTPNAGRIFDAAEARKGACGKRLPTQVPATPTLTPTPRSKPTATPTPTPGPPPCRSPNLPIPADSPAGVSDTVSFPSTGILQDLKVALTIEGAPVGDLVVKLAHVESRKSVTLLDRPGVPSSKKGCGVAGVDATLDDEAAPVAETACNPAPPALKGALRPNELLRAFQGDPDGGTWKLTVLRTGGGSAGRLVTWCLVPRLGGRPTPTPAPTAAPLSR